MRDSELRSPQEWAEELREAASDNAGYVASISDCRELADRMDDLTEAMRLLREVYPDERHYAAFDPIISERDALLAKYASEGD